MKGKKRGILLRMDEETICLLARQAEKNYRSRAREGYRIIFDAVRVGLNIDPNVTTSESDLKEPDKSDGEDVHEKGLALLEELESEGTAEPLEF